MKKLFPEYCPSCHQKLVIKTGEGEDTLNLVCDNDVCIGSILKRLQVGIMSLNIKHLGEKTIEKLLNAGITSSIDLFDPEKMNEEKLIKSGFFDKGKTLDNILNSVKNTKSIHINKAILSLQLENIGKTFSEKIGKHLSGLDVDFAGLQLDIRSELGIKDSNLNKTLNSSLEKMQKFGILIIKYDKEKEQKITKIVNKRVSLDLHTINKISNEIISVVEKLKWDITEITQNDCDFLIVEDKNSNSFEITYAKENNIKILTLKQIKILFI